MFEVYRTETNRVFTVFGVQTKRSEKYVEDDTLFLIFFDEKWQWVDSVYYKPVVQGYLGYFEC